EELLAWHRQVEATREDPFAVARELARRLGGRVVGDGTAAFGFWTPEIVEGEIPEEAVVLEILTPPRDLDPGRTDRREVRLDRTRVPLARQGAYHWGVVTGVRPGTRETIGSLYRLVHESESTTAIVSVARETQSGFEPTRVINQRLSQSIFQAVRQRPDLAFYNVREESTVKVYERVPGATISGHVDTENATTVFAVLRLQTNVNRNFTYVQSVETDDHGNFELTVPYATTNTVGPADGGTDSGVTATGKYELFTGNPFQPSARGNTSVPEPAIYNGETIEVELTPVEPPGGNESTDENTTGSSNESALTGPGAGFDSGGSALFTDSPVQTFRAQLHARDG
ncbi:MAG: glucosylglycerol hydrolase, partial [Halobacteriales archaeon]